MKSLLARLNPQVSLAQRRVICNISSTRYNKLSDENNLDVFEKQPKHFDSPLNVGLHINKNLMYCRSGNSFRCSQIRDFGTFREV